MESQFSQEQLENMKTRELQKLASEINKKEGGPIISGRDKKGLVRKIVNYYKLAEISNIESKSDESDVSELTGPLQMLNFKSTDTEMKTASSSNAEMEVQQKTKSDETLPTVEESGEGEEKEKEGQERFTYV